MLQIKARRQQHRAIKYKVRSTIKRICLCPIVPAVSVELTWVSCNLFTVDHDTRTTYGSIEIDYHHNARFWQMTRVHDFFNLSVIYTLCLKSRGDDGRLAWGPQALLIGEKRRKEPRSPVTVGSRLYTCILTIHIRSRSPI